MNKEFLNHAFELFTQEQQTSRSQYQGTGLGLAIARQLADRMGGTIELLSKVGKGTTAIVQIPFKMGKKDSRLITHASEDISVKGLRALVAEDNDLNMEVIQFMLEDNDIEVLGAKDGKEALDFFEKSQPGYFDVIFMDIMMPHLNGLDATRAIRALNRHDAQEIPIIAVSANAFAVLLTFPLLVEKVNLTKSFCLSMIKLTIQSTEIVFLGEEYGKNSKCTYEVLDAYCE